MPQTWDMSTWGILDRGEAYLKDTFPQLKRNQAYEKYTGFHISTMLQGGKIRCVIRKFDTDRRSMRAYEDIIDVTEDPDVFPSNELIAQIALVVG